MSVFSNIRVTLTTDGNLRAKATCKVADAIYLTGISVFQGATGLFISMPAKKNASGEHLDVYFPASRSMHEELQALVLDAYRSEVAIAKASANA